jgi:cytidylate kinase
MSGKKLTVAIDGPVGSGKSTVAKLVAAELGYMHIDTGAMYRAVALLAHRRNISYSDAHALGRIAKSAKMSFLRVGADQHIFVDGEDIEAEIRTPEMSQASSVVSALPEVRAALVEKQREMGRSGGVVMEGRDIGTVVLPWAEVKVFLTASPEERARRRTIQLREQGVKVDYKQVLAELNARDERDSSRDLAPLKPAPDSVVVDSTHMSLGEVVDKIVELVRSKERSL